MDGAVICVDPDVDDEGLDSEPDRDAGSANDAMMTARRIRRVGKKADGSICDAALVVRWGRICRVYIFYKVTIPGQGCLFSAV